ncbi:B12-binding domain-containing radical SAM protein [Candidatus Bathyarchaeota archaeon]|nr:B12-binding domain-containing radical SAM protein [Candidatus Bathyarchaeota archaeon]
MITVLLISPPYKGLIREPMGLYYLSGVLNSIGISTKIIDLNVDLFSRVEFHEYVQNLDPKIVGITSFTFNFSVAQKVLKEIKRVNSKIITVMGGVHASAIPEKILEETAALDYVVCGEGELTLLEFCRRVLNGEEVNSLDGLAFRDDGKIVVNPPRDLIKNINELPLPNRELLPIKKYPVILVQTSRGCPYNCIFCNINTFYGRKIRLRDPEKVVDECEQVIKKFGVKNFFFFGDSFTFNPSWVEKFCDEIIRKKLDFNWACETRVDNVNRIMLEKMRKAGCVEIQYGIDYGDEEVLKNLGKNISVSCVDEAVTWAKKAGLITGGFFIFNVPGENEETMEKTFNLIQKVPIDAIEVNLLTPFPGTSIWSNPGKYNMRIIEDDFDYYTTKKYVMENLDFPRKNFVPAFKNLLKRLNFIPNYPLEIQDFLKKNIKLNVWREDRFSRYLKLRI